MTPALALGIVLVAVGLLGPILFLAWLSRRRYRSYVDGETVDSPFPPADPDDRYARGLRGVDAGIARAVERERRRRAGPVS